MPQTKTFVLGVGAQKAGTSWLDAYLARSPEVATGCLKEYHLFDVLDLESASGLRETMLAKAERALGRMAHGLGQTRPADAAALQRAVFYADPTAYYDYFARLLAPAGIRAATDLTPSYAGLSAERFTSIREEFGRRGIRVHVIFLLRDPVERIWSAERMYHRNHPERDLVETVEARVLRSFDRPFHEVRTRYQDTLAVLDEVFGPEEVTIELYERLFRQDTLERLCGRIAVAPPPADLAQRVNSSPKSEELSPETIRRVARHYREVYSAVATRLGEATVAECWPHLVDATTGHSAGTG